MTFDPSTLAVLSAGLATPVGALLIYAFSRRANLRQLNATTDASIATSAATLAASLQVQIQVLTEKLAKLEEARTADRVSFVEQLTLSHNENLRISARLAQFETEISIAKRQLKDLRAGLPHNESDSG